MRITFDMDRNLMDALNHIREQVTTSELQMTSGRRVENPSDDPTAAAAWVSNRAEANANDQFSRNLSGLQVSLKTQDSAMNAVVAAMTRGIALGTQGATGTLSDPDRQALAQEILAIQGQLVGLANTSINGVYLFAGTDVTAQPFVLDQTQASGVRYDGNGNAVTVEIAPGQTVQVQGPGSQIFSAPGADAFQAIQDLADALQTNGNISGATAAVKTALDNIAIHRVSLGGALDRLNQADQFLGNQKLLLNQQENDLVGADLAQVITNFTHAQTALQAALQAGTHVSRLNLLDFLQ